MLRPKLATAAIWLCGCSLAVCGEFPDLRSVNADLVIPPLEKGDPRPGKRVKQVLDGAAPGSDVYHVVYLPTNYDQAFHHPVIVEFAGNGGFRNQHGDTSHGVPEGSCLGYGISGGKDFIWICLPFVTEDGSKVATQWWGSPPNYSPASTVAYAKSALKELRQQFNFDDQAVLLCGFSRGAIACNFIGLHDPEIAKLWCGFVAYSHYDGVRDWGLPGTDRQSALARLNRLGDRPQFICHESYAGIRSKGLARTQSYIRESGIEGSFIFTETGFRNHSDAWILRESETRKLLRKWVRGISSIKSALDHLGGINDLGN